MYSTDRVPCTDVLLMMTPPPPLFRRVVVVAVVVTDEDSLMCRWASLMRRNGACKFTAIVS